MNMTAATPAPAARNQPRAKPYRQIDLLRDAMLVLYIVYQLSGGLHALFFSGAASALNQLMSFALLGVGILCCLFDRVRFARVMQGAWPFLLPLALIMVSVLWSDYPSIALKRAVRFAVDLAGFVLLISAYRNSRQFLRTVWIAFSILLVLDVLALAKPSMSITPLGYAGIHLHKNSMGGFSFFALPIFLIGWRERYAGRFSGISLGFALLATAFLLASLSKTSIFVVAFCGMAAFIGYNIWRRGITTQLALCSMFGVLVLGLLAPVTAGGLNVPELVGAVTGDPTMTGRTGVWDYTFWRVGDRQLTGVGYGSFWEVDEILTQGQLEDFGVYFRVNQSHNGYIGTFAELGWLGVGAIFLMWIMAMSAILRRIANAREAPLVGYALYTALGCMLYNITETSFFRAGNDGWMHYLMIMLAVAKLAAPVRTATPAFAAARQRAGAALRPRYAPRRTGPA